MSKEKDGKGTKEDMILGHLEGRGKPYLVFNSLPQEFNVRIDFVEYPDLWVSVSIPWTELLRAIAIQMVESARDSK